MTHETSAHTEYISTPSHKAVKVIFLTLLRPPAPALSQTLRGPAALPPPAQRHPKAEGFASIVSLVSALNSPSLCPSWLRCNDLSP